jgi:hypothetical protein
MNFFVEFAPRITFYAIFLSQDVSGEIQTLEHSIMNPLVH